MNIKNKKSIRYFLVYGILVLFILGLALGVGYPAYKNAHNRNHFTEETCTVTDVETKSGVTSISGKSVAIDTQECGQFEMQKTTDGKSVDDVGEYLKKGNRYKFQFGDYQEWHSPKRAQKVSPFQ